MGLHLYVPDDQERGTDWSCTAEEMLRYATGAEQQQVLAPLRSFYPSPNLWDSGSKNLPV